MSWGVWCQPKDGMKNGAWLHEYGKEEPNIYATEDRARKMSGPSPTWTYEVREYVKS